MKLRVVCWNVHGFKAGVRTVAGVVETLSPDVVLMNECGTQRQVESFADHLKLQAVHASLPWRFIQAPRNAVFARAPWKIVDVDGRGYLKAGGSQPRGVVMAGLIGPDDARAAAVATHLGLHQGERVIHAGELLQMVDGQPYPAFVGGDFNELPTGPSVRAMITAGLVDAWDARAGAGEGMTYPADEPTARIDYLFVPDRIRVEGVEVVGTAAAMAASDHRPLVVDVAW